MILPICAHHAESPGELREVYPCQCGANFRARRKPPERVEVQQDEQSKVRYIPLTLRMVAIVDGNSLNNRRSNLRICTPGQNNHNRQFKGNRSGFAGVYPCGKKWRIVLQYRGKIVHSAVFDDKIEAAKARDRKALELYGKFACLNFPEDKSNSEEQTAE